MASRTGNPASWFGESGLPTQLSTRALNLLAASACIEPGHHHRTAGNHDRHRTRTLVGWFVVQTLEDKGFDTVTLPVVPLVVIAVAGAVAGGLIATLPARRASSLNILDALETN